MNKDTYWLWAMRGFRGLTVMVRWLVKERVPAPGVVRGELRKVHKALGECIDQMEIDES